MSTATNFAGSICLDRMIELAIELRGPIESGEELTLDGESFSSVDFAGIQMLLAAQRRAQKTGAVLRVRVPQEGVLRDALRRYGVEPCHLPFVEAA